MTIPPGRAPTSRHQGWTLVELLVTGLILVILAGIAVPAMRDGINRSSELALFNLLGHAAAFARTRAVAAQRYVTLCGSDDGAHCRGQWHRHIIVFSDRNRNQIVDGPDQLYRMFTLNPETPCIRWRGGARRNYLQFKPSGASNGTAGHFQLCDPRADHLHQRLVVSLNGRSALRAF